MIELSKQVTVYAAIYHVRFEAKNSWIFMHALYATVSITRLNYKFYMWCL